MPVRYPAVFTGQVPIGTKRETCPITALLVSGCDTRLYKYCQYECFGRAANRASIPGVSATLRDEMQACVEQNWNAFYATFIRATFFSELDTKRMDCCTSLAAFSKIGIEQTFFLHDGSMMVGQHFVPTLFRSHGMAGNVEVPVVLAETIDQTFGYSTNTLLHGKGHGVHEGG